MILSVVLREVGKRRGEKRGCGMNYEELCELEVKRMGLEEVKRKTKEVVRQMEEERRKNWKGRFKRGWWNEECRAKKKE
ncbi:hypothetical protein KM043_018893, partial [Ampulex compressa]